MSTNGFSAPFATVLPCGLPRRRGGCCRLGHRSAQAVLVQAGVLVTAGENQRQPDREKHAPDFEEEAH
eukprot:3854002-Karenia_brevis.AAC.1